MFPIEEKRRNQANKRKFLSNWVLLYRLMIHSWYFKSLSFTCWIAFLVNLVIAASKVPYKLLGQHLGVNVEKCFMAKFTFTRCPRVVLAYLLNFHLWLNRLRACKKVPFRKLLRMSTTLETKILVKSSFSNSSSNLFFLLQFSAHHNQKLAHHHRNIEILKWRKKIITWLTKSLNYVL